MLNIVKSNNPCAIRSTADQWQGKVGNSRGFVVFNSPIAGVRAGMVIIENYIKRGDNTLIKIFNKYAPTVDFNNPSKYAETVLKKINETPLYSAARVPSVNTVLSGDKKTIANIVKAVTEVETGGEFAKTFDATQVLTFAYSYFVSGVAPVAVETPNSLYVVDRAGRRLSGNLKKIDFKSLGMNGQIEKQTRTDSLKVVSVLFFLSAAYLIYYYYFKK